MFGKKGINIAHHADKYIVEIFDQRHQYFDLGAFTAFADDNHHVVLLHNAQVTMNGIGGMHEDSRGAGGVKRCHDLLRNDSTFADTTDDYPAIATGNSVNRFFKIIIYKPG